MHKRAFQTTFFILAITSLLLSTALLAVQNRQKPKEFSIVQASATGMAGNQGHRIILQTKWPLTSVQVTAIAQSVVDIYKVKDVIYSGGKNGGKPVGIIIFFQDGPTIDSLKYAVKARAQWNVKNGISVDIFDKGDKPTPKVKEAGNIVILMSTSKRPIDISDSDSAWTDDHIIKQVPPGTKAEILEVKKIPLFGGEFLVRNRVKVVIDGKTFVGWVAGDDCK